LQVRRSLPRITIITTTGIITTTTLKTVLGLETAPVPGRGAGSCLGAGTLIIFPVLSGTCYIPRMKKILAAALLLMVFAGPAFARTRHHRPPKPLHQNAPHSYTKHHATKHPTAVHPHRKA
jgi:hypothetical protein